MARKTPRDLRPWLCLALAALVLVPYAQVWEHEFTALDDPHYVTANPQVQEGVTLRGVAWAFTTIEAANWHPVTWLSHMVDIEMFGLRPGPHHMVSVLMHAANAVLLFLSLAGMTGNVWPSALVAALFAVHPLRVESVAWASERKDVLSGLFFMLTLLAYRRYTRRPGVGSFLAVSASLAAGLLAKPMLVTMPFVLLLLDVWPLGRTRLGTSVLVSPRGAAPGRGLSIPRLLLEKAPLMALAAISAAVTLFAQGRGGTVMSFEVVPAVGRATNAMAAYVVYLWKTLWPADLAFLYPHPALLRSPAEGILVTHGLVAGVLLAATTAVLLRQARRRPYLLVGWLWFIVMLLPVIGLVQVGAQAWADRYTYLPLVGVSVMVAWGAREIAGKWARRRAGVATSAAIAIVVLGVTTWRQVRVWRDSETLYRHALSVTRDNYVAHNSLGSVLEGRGSLADARVQYERALSIKPDHALAMYNLGVLLEKQGDRAGARQQYEQALRADPRSAQARNNLAGLAVAAGDVEVARFHYEALTRAHPDFEPAYSNLALLLARSGDLTGAGDLFRRAVAIDPRSAPAHLGLGRVLVLRGDLREALGHYERSLELEPAQPEARAEAHELREALGGAASGGAGPGPGGH